MGGGQGPEWGRTKVRHIVGFNGGGQGHDRAGRDQGIYTKYACMRLSGNMYHDVLNTHECALSGSDCRQQKAYVRTVNSMATPSLMRSLD